MENFKKFQENDFDKINTQKNTFEPVSVNYN